MLEVYHKIKSMNQLEILSPTLNEFIVRNYPDYNGDRSIIKHEYEVPLEIPEFDIFTSCKVVFSSTNFVVMLQSNELKLFHLNKLIKLISKLTAFFGSDDYDNNDFAFSDLEELFDNEDDYISSITRLWKEKFDNNCTCALDISLEDCNALFIIDFDV